MKGRRILKQPSSRAHPLKLALWRASGPGRAEGIRDYALGIDPGEPLSRDAPGWIKRAKKILRFYRKGSDAWASRELERLRAEIAQAEREHAKRSSSASTGGTKAGETKKAEAARWQKKFRPEAERLRKAGLSAENIGARLSEKTDGPKPARRLRLCHPGRWRAGSILYALRPRGQSSSASTPVERFYKQASRHRVSP